MLRSIGMTKKDIESITLHEATVNILSATIIGFFTGYILAMISMLMLTSVWEIPIVFEINWLILFWLIIVTFTIVIIGTKICIYSVNKMRISSILKGD